MTVSDRPDHRACLTRGWAAAAEPSSGTSRRRRPRPGRPPGRVLRPSAADPACWADRQGPRPGQPDPAVPDRHLELESRYRLGPRPPPTGGEVPEVDVSTLLEPDEAVVGHPPSWGRPSTQAARRRVRGLDPGETGHTRPGKRPVRGAIAARPRIYRAAASCACSAARRPAAAWLPGCHRLRPAR